MSARNRKSENCIFIVAIAIVVIGLVVAGFIIISGARNRSFTNVTVEVPDRFRGVIRIAIDPAAQKFPGSSNHVYIKVPESGYLAASNYPEGWMSIKGRYTSGKELPVYPGNGDYSEKETSGMIMLRGLGSFSGSYIIDGETAGPDEEIRYVVGTKTDYLNALDIRNSYTSKTMVWFDEE